MAGSRRSIISPSPAITTPSAWGTAALRVWNDDEIAPNTGFPPHPHADMEIITYVRQGAITHEDSLGHKGRTEAGDVQVMSAGSGIRHAEYNREPVPTTLFQIWIEPEARRRRAVVGRQAVSQVGSLGPLRAAGERLRRGRRRAADQGARPRARRHAQGRRRRQYELGAKRHGYLVPAQGSVEVNGVRILTRDGAAISNEPVLKIKALEDSEIVLVDAA